MTALIVVVIFATIGILYGLNDIVKELYKLRTILDRTEDKIRNIEKEISNAPSWRNR